MRHSFFLLILNQRAKLVLRVCLSLAFLLIYRESVEMRVLRNGLVELIDEKALIVDDFLRGDGAD